MVDGSRVAVRGTGPRVLVLSGGTGAGHTVAAQAVEGELQRAGFAVAHLDAYAFVSKPARWAYTQLHLGLMEFVPELYGPLYERGSRSRLLVAVQQRLAQRSRADFASALVQIRPDVVFATHALGCLLAAPLKEVAHFRLAVLTTDYRAHAFHVDPRVDCYCVSHSWAAADLQAAGISRDRIVVTGIPLRERFDQAPDQVNARTLLGLPLDAQVILVTRGGMAAGMETVDLLHALLAAPDLRACVFVAVLGGRERGFRLVLQNVPPTPRLRVERHVEAMEAYLASADVVVGKAGGLSSTETFAVGRPLVIFAPNEGVETSNVARFVAAGASVNAGREPAKVVSAVQELLRSPERRDALVSAGQALLTKESRRAVREAIARLALEHPVPVGVSAQSA